VLVAKRHIELHHTSEFAAVKQHLGVFSVLVHGLLSVLMDWAVVNSVTTTTASASVRPASCVHLLQFHLFFHFNFQFLAFNYQFLAFNFQFLAFNYQLGASGKSERKRARASDGT